MQKRIILFAENMPVPILTLTSDLGLRDSYVPSVKGQLLRHLPDANIVDVTHQIEPFNIAEASFILKGCYADFPRGTVHLVSVDADVRMTLRYMLVQTAEYTFLVPDNGLISLVLEDAQVQQAIELPYQPEDLVFPLKNILAPAAIKLLQGAQAVDLGRAGTNYVRRAHQRPVANEHIIRGSVMYVDHMGNAVTNISSEEVQYYGRGRNFYVYISRTEYFEQVSLHYNEVEEGEKLCLFGDQNFLEIAINKGNASGLLGLKIGSTVLVEFI